MNQEQDLDKYSNEAIQALVRLRDRAKLELEKAEKALEILGSPPIGRGSLTGLAMSDAIARVLQELDRPAEVEEIREGLIAGRSDALLMEPSKKYKVVERRQSQQIRSAISLFSSLTEKSKEVLFKTIDELVGLACWSDSKWEKP